MNLDSDGIDLVIYEETGGQQPSLTPYSDPPGESIYMGHFINSPQDDWMLNGITDDQGKEIFASDCAERVTELNNLFSARIAAGKMTQNQFNALFDTLYNCGAGGMMNAGLVSAINNDDDQETITNIWTTNPWMVNSTINGVEQKNPELVARRNNDVNLYFNGSY